MWEQFNKFAFKGNVIDMAVGVIIGGAFGKIVSSIVNDIIMPFFGYITAGVKFTDLKLVLGSNPGVEITYGNFLQNVVDFFIIAFSIFVFVKMLNRAQRKIVRKQEEEPKEKVPSQEELLVEIRDLLKAQNKDIPHRFQDENDYR